MADKVETTTPAVEATESVETPVETHLEATNGDSKEAEPAKNGDSTNGKHDSTNGKHDEVTNGDKPEKNGDAEDKPETNGHADEDDRVNTTESSNGDTNGAAKVTEEKEATKRPAEAGDEEATPGKIAKLKKAAAEKISEVTTTEETTA